MYTVRRCRPEDAQGVVQVARTTWHATYEDIIPANIRNQVLDQWYDVDLIANRAERGSSLFLVAVGEADEVVGYASANHWQSPGDAELYSIYVLPACQGQGIGGKLLGEVIRGLSERKPLERLYVQVERDNRIGRAFYDRLGFMPTREFTEDIMGHTSTMLEMMLTVEGVHGFRDGLGR